MLVGQVSPLLDYTSDSVLTMRTVTDIELKMCVDGLRGSAPGHDSVTASIVQDNFAIPCGPLLNIVNSSIAHFMESF